MKVFFILQTGTNVNKIRVRIMGPVVTHMARTTASAALAGRDLCVLTVKGHGPCYFTFCSTKIRMTIHLFDSLILYIYITTHSVL